MDLSTKLSHKRSALAAGFLMSFSVFCERRLQSEFLTAVVAGVRQRRRMQLLVLPELTGTRKPAAADFAGERFLSGVRSRVVLEHRR